jgi:hypothetical protein
VFYFFLKQKVARVVIKWCRKKRQRACDSRGAGVSTGGFGMADKSESRVGIPALQPKYAVRGQWIKPICTDLAVDR